MGKNSAVVLKDLGCFGSTLTTFAFDVFQKREAVPYIEIVPQPIRTHRSIFSSNYIYKINLI